MRIFFIGDVIGDPGRKALFALLPGVRVSFNAVLIDMDESTVRLIV
jgi:calcineurin-like phosphoesterase